MCVDARKLEKDCERGKEVLVEMAREGRRPHVKGRMGGGCATRSI